MTTTEIGDLVAGLMKPEAKTESACTALKSIIAEKKAAYDIVASVGKTWKPNLFISPYN